MIVPVGLPAGGKVLLGTENHMETGTPDGTTHGPVMELQGSIVGVVVVGALVIVKFTGAELLALKLESPV